MAKVICTVCGREIDSRGLSGHMKTHKGKEDDTDGVISYPSNEQEIKETDTVVDLDESQGKRVKKTVKKQVKPASKPANKPASKPASKPDAGGQDKPYTGSKNTGHPKDSGAYKSRKWQGLFRD